MTFCGHCGEPILQGAAFCGKCGTRVPIQEAQESCVVDPGFRADPPIPMQAPSASGPLGTAPSSAESALPLRATSAFNPQASSGNAAPRFNPPVNAAKSAPASSAQQSSAGSAPVFTPPNYSGKAAPVFTPPSAPSFNGPACRWHSDQPATDRCAQCGTPICKDCVEAYTFTSGEYVGRSFCYDCITQMFREEHDELEENYATIKSRRILVLVGIVVGLLVGLWITIGGGMRDVASIIFWCIVCMAIGGSFVTFIKGFLSHIGSVISPWSQDNVAIAVIGWLVKAIFYFCIDFVKSFVETVRKLVAYSAYIRRTSHVLADNEQAMQQIQAFMEYSQLMSSNKGVDFETLASQHSELYNNSYAQQLQREGEAAADAHLRSMATRIAANGEIIRDFAA